MEVEVAVCQLVGVAGTDPSEGEGETKEERVGTVEIDSLAVQK